MSPAAAVRLMGAAEDKREAARTTKDEERSIVDLNVRKVLSKQ